MTASPVTGDVNRASLLVQHVQEARAQEEMWPDAIEGAGPDAQIGDPHRLQQDEHGTAKLLEPVPLQGGLVREDPDHWAQDHHHRGHQQVFVAASNSKVALKGSESACDLNGEVPPG